MVFCTGGITKSSLRDSIEVGCVLYPHLRGLRPLRWGITTISAVPASPPLVPPALARTIRYLCHPLRAGGTILWFYIH